jgi:hypothetical protein
MKCLQLVAKQSERSRRAEYGRGGAGGRNMDGSRVPDVPRIACPADAVAGLHLPRGGVRLGRATDGRVRRRRPSR